jgi:hypothetical protein
MIAVAFLLFSNEQALIPGSRNYIFRKKIANKNIDTWVNFKETIIHTFSPHFLGSCFFC